MENKNIIKMSSLRSSNGDLTDEEMGAVIFDEMLKQNTTILDLENIQSVGIKTWMKLLVNFNEKLGWDFVKFADELTFIDINRNLKTNFTNWFSKFNSRRRTDYDFLYGIINK